MPQTARKTQLDVRQDHPVKPLHSLPSYAEPTPETHRRISREEEAELSLTRTRFGRGARVLLIAFFLVTIALVPLFQAVSELRRHQPLTLIAPLRLLHGYSIPRAAEIKSVEQQIERSSLISAWLLPSAQLFLTKYFGAGNEQVYVGRDGWLFYRPDVEFVTGLPFLSAAQLHHRTIKADVQPDPIRAITQFRDQLAARGIDLIVVPAPSKAGIEPEKLSTRASQAPVTNASFTEWEKRLRLAGVRVFSTDAILAGRKAATHQPQYLAADSHWTPEAMEFIAAKLAQTLGQAKSNLTPLAAQEIDGTGDIAQMLKLPKNQTLFPPQRLAIHRVTNGAALWRADPAADVLLLGDSFTNIYSLEAMGWGESAGFAEHLSRALGKPIDVLARNSDGAFATREMLAQELAHGRDRLAGKKLVIWEFAARELAFGDWKLLDMTLREKAPAQFFSAKPGEAVVVTATVEAASPVPQPGSVPYKEHIMSLHLVDLAGLTNIRSAQALVYTWSMRNNIWTPAARLRPGEKVRLRLRAWSDVAAELQKFNRSEIDDPTVQMEEPSWGELLP